MDVFRLIDANLARLGEALRVIEDVCRFELCNSNLTHHCQELRHQLKATAQQFNTADLVNARSIALDTRAKSTVPQRLDLNDLITASIKRATQAARCLEEATITNPLRTCATIVMPWNKPFGHTGRVPHLRALAFMWCPTHPSTFSTWPIIRACPLCNTATNQHPKPIFFLYANPLPNACKIDPRVLLLMTMWTLPVLSGLMGFMWGKTIFQPRIFDPSWGTPNSLVEPPTRWIKDYWRQRWCRLCERWTHLGYAL